MSNTQTPAPAPSVVLAKSAKNSLKYAAPVVAGALSLTVNGVAYTIPVDVRLLTDANEAEGIAPTAGYLSVKEFSSMVDFDTDNGTVIAMEPERDCTEVIAKLKPQGESSPRAKADAPKLADDMAAQLKQLLANVPAGFKLDLSDGTPKLIRTRNRKPKGEKQGTDNAQAQPAPAATPAPATQPETNTPAPQPGKRNRK